jgi:hypothetical protein
VVIDRYAWHVHGDLLQWLATEFPGLSNAQFEAGYRLLADPNVSDAAAEQVEVMLAGCVVAAAAREEEQSQSGTRPPSVSGLHSG